MGEAVGDAVGDVVGAAVAELVELGVALADVDGVVVAEELEEDDGLVLADALLVGAGIDGVVDADVGLALADSRDALEVGVGSIVPVRDVTDDDVVGVGDALALLVGDEGEAELEAVGLAVNVAVAVGVAEDGGDEVAEEELLTDAEGEAFDEIGVALAELVGVALPEAEGVTIGRAVAGSHLSGILVTVVMTPPTSGDAITGTVAMIDNTTALTVVSAISAVRLARTTGEIKAFIGPK